MSDLNEIEEQLRHGMVPGHFYSDQELFDREVDRLFGRSWVFLAHESEIPEPGDYVVRKVVEDSFIVVRDEEGIVRVHFNMCLHRGMQVCRAEMGNTSHFRCPYHGWSYRNNGKLSGLPFHQEAYGGDDGFARTGQTLIQPDRVDSYRGLIFIAISDEAPPLLDFIGDYAFYLDLYTNQSPSGLELRGPQRWRVRSNWKIGAENFVGDMYHTPYTHRSVVDIGLFREPKAHKRKEGILYFAGRGGGTTYKLPDGDLRERLNYVGYPDEMVDRMAKRWSPQQKSFVEDHGLMVSASTLFPNLSFVHNWPQIDDAGQVTPFISLRQWQPISPTETEVLSWFAVDAEAPEQYKEDSYRAYLMCFGSSGMFEQDDVENWVSITSVSKGRMARKLLLNARMGLDSSDEPLIPEIADFAGPGSARAGFNEFNQRAWMNLWTDLVLGDGTKADFDSFTAGA